MRKRKERGKIRADSHRMTVTTGTRKQVFERAGLGGQDAEPATNETIGAPALLRPLEESKRRRERTLHQEQNEARRWARIKRCRVRVGTRGSHQSANYKGYQEGGEVIREGGETRGLCKETKENYLSFRDGLERGAVGVSSTKRLKRKVGEGEERGTHLKLFATGDQKKHG